MTPISNYEQIKGLKVDERLIECFQGNVHYYKFLCIHPHNDQYVILLNSCEEPIRFYYQTIIDFFYRDYNQRDVINYRKDYALKKVKDLEQKLALLGDMNNGKG